jgi:hypothetical protein
VRNPKGFVGTGACSAELAIAETSGFTCNDK